MIAHLRGIISQIQSQYIVVDVQGVGYAVCIADERIYNVGQLVDLPIYYHWNQENGPQLFGFEASLNRTVFSLIIGCTGCGPKLGLAILAAMTPADFLQAITLADTKALSRVSGVGPKKAELLVMQLKDKVPKIITGPGVAQNSNLVKIKQLHAALGALHYRPAEIAAALEFLPTQVAIDAGSFDELLRKALTFLAKK
jgi:holliday junction DNA helicase RuvA